MNSEFHKSCRILANDLGSFLAPHGFTIDSCSPYNKDWHRFFIVSSHTVSGHRCQIGRVTLQRVQNKAKVYYIKSYKKHEYLFNYYDDVVWPLIEGWVHGIKITSDDLEYAMVEAYLINYRQINAQKEWRENNPIKRRRKKLTGRQIQYLFKNVLGYIALKN